MSYSLRTGRETPLGKWGWKLFARKGNRNIAAVARKLLVQVWHLLRGNPPEALEADKSLTLKLNKLAVALGKERRIALSLPAALDDCVKQLRERIGASTAPPPQEILNPPRKVAHKNPSLRRATQRSILATEPCGQLSSKPASINTPHRELSKNNSPKEKT